MAKKTKNMFDVKPKKMFKLAKGMFGVAVGAAAIGVATSFLKGK